MIIFLNRIKDTKMKTTFLICSMAVLAILSSAKSARAQEKPQMVRIAKLQIDSSQLDRYTTELKEEIEASIRLEPGVLTLYAVAEKENPSSITIFETYASEDAYKSHLETPHFKKYKAGTKEMVKSLQLIEVSPIILGSK